jgi:hypothetical protein
MYKFSLPFYNISGCEPEQNEERLIEWLTEQTGESVLPCRTVKTIQDGIITTIYQDDPQWDDYWNFEVPGAVDLIVTVGGETWRHTRVAKFMIYDNGGWEELLDESETYFIIDDEYLALQFKLIM